MAINLPPFLSKPVDNESLTYSTVNHDTARKGFYAKLSAFADEASTTDADFAAGLKNITDVRLKRDYLAWKYPLIFKQFDSGAGGNDSTSPLSDPNDGPEKVPATQRSAVVETPKPRDAVFFHGEALAGGGVQKFIELATKGGEINGQKVPRFSPRDLSILKSVELFRDANDQKAVNDLFRDGMDAPKRK